MVENEIMVSINCITYNHESYVADAIEGFLMQKTNFSYEILIHDDASTDGTQKIIREFELKYPDLIKPIYRTENQYSKGVEVDRFNRERAKGKYITICEGDDYWTDPYKLQKQVDFMQKHPECSLCVHAAYTVQSDRNKLGLPIRPNHGNKVFTVGEVIRGGGGLFATNSILYRAIFDNNRPEFFENAPVGDYPLVIYLALRGSVYYLDEFMSAYRADVPGSWTNRVLLSNIDNYIAHFDAIADMLQDINEYSGYKYDTSIKETIKHNKFHVLLKQGVYREAKKEIFKEFYSELEWIDKIKIFVKQHFPGIAKILFKIKWGFVHEN